MNESFSTPPRSMPFPPGTVLAGKYRVERLLGEGGMGWVVEATHLQLEQRVAVKFMHPEQAIEHPDSVGRFLREARAAARIQSEHVARVSDFGTLENGAPYLVMEYLEGRDLEAELRSRGKLPVLVAVDYAMQACEGLAEAHAAGIVHRDLKPGNLFLARRSDGSVRLKLLDFGISKLSPIPGGTDQASMTSTQALMGSPLYMSPEQLRSSKNVDRRADIWSLGIIVFEMLAGRAPFDGETLPEICARIMAEPPLPLRQARPELSEALAAVVMRCLDKDPKTRFQDVGGLAQGLAPFGTPDMRAVAERIARVARPLAASSPELWAQPADAASPLAASARSGVAQTNASFSTAGDAPLRRSTRPRWVVAGGLLVVVAAAVIGLVATRGRRVEATASRASAAARAGGVRDAGRVRDGDGAHRSGTLGFGDDLACASRLGAGGRAGAHVGAPGRSDGAAKGAAQAEGRDHGPQRQAGRHERLRGARLMRRALGAATLALAGLAPRHAAAQTKDDVARAEAAFNAAKALTDAGQYQDACAKFAESKRLAPGVGVTLYLADCYERIGRTASAWTEFRSAEGQARERNDKRAEVARGRAQALEPKLNRVTITVAPTVPLTGLQVLRDGLPVEQEERGLAVPVDPGDHVVVVSSPGHVPRTVKAHVGPESPTATVAIDSLGERTGASPEPSPPPMPAAAAPPGPAAPTAMPAAMGAAPPGRPAEDPGQTRRWLGLGVAGAGVIGVGIGSAFGIMAKGKLDQSNGSHCDSTDHCDPTGLSWRKDAQSDALASTVLFVAGGVALAAGVVLYVTAPRASAASAIVVAPAPLAGGGGAIVRTSF